MGVQLARGFPPRSKWTYREVFHPAVVPPPPFIKLFLFLQFIIMGKCVCHSCSNKCFWGLRFQGLSFWVSVFTDFWSQSAQISGSRNFWVLGFFFFWVSPLGLCLLQVQVNGLRLLGCRFSLNVCSQSFGFWVIGFQVLGFSGHGNFFGSQVSLGSGLMGLGLWVLPFFQSL